MNLVRFLALKFFAPILLVAFASAAPAHAQSAPNFDGVWRGTWTRGQTATYELDISNSQTGTAVVKQTRWPGTDTSGQGISQTFTATREGEELHYELKQPVVGQVALKLKNPNEITGTFTLFDRYTPGQASTMDLARK